MRGTVLVSPQESIEAECIARALRAAAVDATTDVETDGVLAHVAILVPGLRTSPGKSVSSRDCPLLLVVYRVDDDALDVMADTGAVGLISARASTSELVAAVRSFVGGNGLPESPTAGPSVGGRGKPGVGAGRLTAREQEVAALLGEGWRNDEIAEFLGISHHTVRTHVQHVLSKLGVPHRGAVARATAHPSMGRESRRPGSFVPAGRG